MKLLLNTAILLLVFNFQLISQKNSTVLTSLKIESKTLHRTINYSVYLPFSYYSDTLKYPVIYLLHGYSGDETSWVKQGWLNNIADSLIIESALPESIVIMPNSGNSYYINDYKNNNNYEDFFINELIPFVDSVYRTKKEKSSRAICGLSMGGFGAIILPLKHSEIFGHSISLSAAVRTPEAFVSLPQDKYQNYFGKIFGDSLKGESRITEHWKQNSPFFLIDSTKAKELCTINWYIDCGMYDFLFDSNKSFHELLLKYQIPHEYHMRIGYHNLEYWQSGFINGLLYLGKQWKTLKIK